MYEENGRSFIHEEIFAFKATTFRMRIGPLYAKGKHPSCIFSPFTSWPINSYYLFGKDKTQSRNMKLGQELEKGSFEACSNDKAELLDMNSIIILGIKMQVKFLTAETDENNDRENLKKKS